jgi:ABC-2 type transport system ATP-binding protein
MIEIIDASKSYEKGKNAVDKLNLKIDDSMIFGFLGPNGAGKTTTIKMITGIISADEGEIIVDGYSIKREPLKVKMNFGYVPDNSDIVWRLKGLEYLNFLADIYRVSKEKRKERIEKYSEMFDLKDNLNQYITTYSRGMKQKLMLIASLLNDPKNWILDEPIVGLDPVVAHALKTEMQQRAKDGGCVFFSTHILEIAEQLCDKVAIINKGCLLFEGTIEEVKEAKNQENSLEQLFLELVDG